ncbi:hypothetical protein ALC60_05994 [Trachymyrmex zeteki]|uniref:Uncharacterized protein n=1 Tax=Mycetomoellerius zeteki TaxID=64791 RepID=A0A151X413_9HYME|nr:hypothetical protein ALC60_05994 [Trachymyrmex zeteki]
MAARKKGVASIRGHLPRRPRTIAVIRERERIQTEDRRSAEEEEEERCCIKTALDNDREARGCRRKRQAVEETDESHLRQWRLIAVVSSGVSTKKEIGGRVEGKMREAVVAEEEGMTTRRGLSLDVIDVAGHESTTTTTTTMATATTMATTNTTPKRERKKEKMRAMSDTSTSSTTRRECRVLGREQSPSQARAGRERKMVSSPPLMEGGDNQEHRPTLPSDQPNDRLFADRLRKRERKEIAH